MRAAVDVDELLRLLARSDPDSRRRALELAERLEAIGAILVDELGGVPSAAAGADGP